MRLSRSLVDSAAVSAQPNSPLPPGTRLAHFEIRRPLGEGAMGVVYEAYDTSLDRAVAVKVVHAIHATNPDVNARFLEEPRLAARVVHDHLAHVYFVGITDGRPFYAMELVAGRTLERLVIDDGAMPIGRAVDVLVQIAKGLAAVHAAGLVHRDVKPGNVLVSVEGRVKLTDFGLSKPLGGVSGRTEMGSVIGTPEYMSPEQCRGETVDARTDIYALGLTAYVMLTGAKPWSGSTLGALLDQQMNAPLPSVVARRPDLPPDVDTVLGRLTSKNRAERPATMADVAVLLERLRPRTIVSAPIVARGAAFAIDLSVLGLLVAGSTKAIDWTTHRLGIGGVGLILEGLVATALLLMLLPGMERRFGGSVGKLLLRLEVTRDDGTRPDVRTLAYRLVLRAPYFPSMLVPDAWLPSWADFAVTALFFGWTLALFVSYFVNRGRTFCDVLSRTHVTYAAHHR